MAYAMLGTMNRDYAYSYKENKPPVNDYKKVPGGKTRFIYDDGFECWALNKKNADRKHDNYIKTILK
jgi:hypothetical protein